MASPWGGSWGSAWGTSWKLPAGAVACSWLETWGQSWGESWCRTGVIPPTPTPTPDTGQRKGGIPGKAARKRRRERVYIKLDERTLWFANEANALAFLRQHARTLEARVTAEVERKSHVIVGARELPAVETGPIELPRLTVRGSEEAQEFAREIDRRMRAILLLLDAQAYADLLDDEDEIMLLQ